MSILRWFFIKDGFKFYVCEQVKDNILNEICLFAESNNIKPVVITMLENDALAEIELLKKKFELKYNIRIYLRTLESFDYKSKRLNV